MPLLREQNRNAYNSRLTPQLPVAATMKILHLCLLLLATFLPGTLAAQDRTAQTILNPVSYTHLTLPTTERV